MNDRELEERLAFAIEVTREAGKITLEHFRARELDEEIKSDGTPVTVADRRAERHLRERIERDWPDDAILGEEEGESPGTSGARWILDPIDGTESFRRGVPLYGTLVGLESGAGSATGDAAEPVLGVIGCPAAGELVAAARGRGAWWYLDGEAEPREARVSSAPSLDEALFAVTSSELFAPSGFPGLYEALGEACRDVRGWSDCYGHLLVATGRIDAMVDPLMNAWDNAPLLPVIEEAGGRFTSLLGERTIHGTSALSTNGHVHAEILALAARAARESTVRDPRM